MKFCNVCKQNLPLARFYRGSGSQGRMAQCKVCRVDYARWARLKTLYGITKDEYLSMLEAQGGVCGVCGEPETRKGGEFLCVDHDHESLQVRGLLCFRCNSALGLLQEDIEVVRQLCLYLTRASHVEHRHQVDEGIRLNRASDPKD